MVSTHPLETREASGRSRPWSIGSQLLGHYDEGRRSHDATSPPPTYGFNLQSSPSVHNQNGTTENIPLSNGLTTQGGSPRAASRNATSSDNDVEIQDQRPVLRASTTFYERIITDWWWWELFSCFISFICVAAIVGVLVLYDGKKQPEFVVPGISLNAYVAVFAAIAKAALILPVSEAIGQLKWMWFLEDRKLYDFFTLDNASRGPWGSLMLIGATKCRHLVSLGAVITILALAFEPFFQQIVSFPARDVMHGVSTVMIAKRYETVDDVNDVVSGDFTWFGVGVSRSIVVAVAEAVMFRNESIRPAPSLCPTGRCNWTSYSTLGVCHKCQDVSNMFGIRRVCNKYEIMLEPEGGNSYRNPCGYQSNDTLLVGTSGYKQKVAIVLSTIVVGERVGFDEPVRYWNSTVFADAFSPILNFYVAYTPGGEPQVRQNATPVVKECLYHWCVKEYQASYEGGSLNETILTTYSMQHRPRDVSAKNQSNDMALQLTVGIESYSVAENTTSSLGRAIRANLPKILSNQRTDSAGQHSGKWNFVQTAPYDIDPLLTDMADAVTNSIRTHRNIGIQEANGNAWVTENFVKAQWLWFILPGSLLVGSWVLVCATILKSRKENAPSWKSSALATLLHGLSEGARERFPSKTSPSEIEVITRNMQVRLSSQGGTTRLAVV